MTSQHEAFARPRVALVFAIPAPDRRFDDPPAEGIISVSLGIIFRCGFRLSEFCPLPQSASALVVCCRHLHRSHLSVAAATGFESRPREAQNRRRALNRRATDKRRVGEIMATASENRQTLPSMGGAQRRRGSFKKFVEFLKLLLTYIKEALLIELGIPIFDLDKTVEDLGLQHFMDERRKEFKSLCYPGMDRILVASFEQHDWLRGKQRAILDIDKTGNIDIMEIEYCYIMVSSYTYRELCELTVDARRLLKNALYWASRQ